MKIPMIRIFSFDYGDKELTKCTKEELLEVIEYMATKWNCEKMGYRNGRFE
jgi:hypothetical protein